MAAALTQLKADRLDGMAEFAALLAARGALRPGVSKAQAADVLWTLNSPEVYELLVLDRRWNRRRYAQWIADQLATALLDWAPAASARRAHPFFRRQTSK